MNKLDPDSLDLLEALESTKAEYLIVGAHALAVYGLVRATGDVDVLVRPTVENSQRVYDALVIFGAPVVAHGLDARYFSTVDRVYQLGLAPRRIDLLSSLTGISTDEAFSSPTQADVGGKQRLVLSLAALLKNKRATGRTKDLADVARLEELLKR
ncbi:MAG: hypothetical protein K1X64_09870 [Myxococcaceae bacterium]|nr:hypothetical protein [Myxococcaceae bacterium]